MFPEAKPRETLRFEGNKINFFTRDQSLSDLLYSQRRHQKTQCRNGGRRSTFAGNSNSALLPSDVIDFSVMLLICDQAFFFRRNAKI